MTARPFPIPVVAAFGPGSQPDEDGELDYLPLPSGMETYRPPRLPDSWAPHGRAGATQVLRAALGALEAGAGASRTIPLEGLHGDELALLNQVLGEGEVCAQVLGGARVQESVFAGLWRVVEPLADGTLRDRLEIGAIPSCLLQAARADAPALPADPPDPPPGLMNAPALVAELREHCLGPDAAAPRVLNLSLLPLSPDDAAWLDAQLGTGRVQILSRGYGNCRIASTRMPNAWRVTYYNSQDKVILDAIEISPIPDVACAAAEDLLDSAHRLAEVLHWVEDGPAGVPEGQT